MTFMLWFDFLALSTLFFLNFRPKGRQTCLRKMINPIRAAIRNMTMTARRIGMMVGDSISGTVALPIVVVTASVVEPACASSSAPSMYVLFCSAGTFVRFVEGFVEGKKNPLPSLLIGVGRDPKSGSLGNVCFGGIKLSLRVLPLIPVIVTRT